MTGRAFSLCLLSRVWTWFEDKQTSLFSLKSKSISCEFKSFLAESAWKTSLFSTNCQKQSALQNQVQLPIHCARFIGSAKPDISHVLMSYLRRCLSHRHMPSPWKYRSPLLSSPAGRHSASRSCPECICHCHYTSQGIPLQGKQPHVQTHWKDKSMQPGKGLIKQRFPFNSPLPVGVVPLGVNCPSLVSGQWGPWNGLLSPRRSSQYSLTNRIEGMVSFREAMRFFCFIGSKTHPAF